MGLQAAIKSTTKRKYEIETDCEAEKKEEASPPKSLKFSDVTTKILSPINNKSNTNNNNIGSINNGTTNAVVKSIKSDIIPPETHHQWGSNEPIVDSISKLQAVTETWSNSTLSSTIPFNCTSSTLTSLAQTAENITRSTLATTLLDQDDLSEDDEDDFQDDFDFDDEDDDDLLLDDHTVITTNHNYTPIRYPSSPSPTRQNYIPAYPKPGYAPENYQNCSRTPIVAQQQYSQQQQQVPPQSQPHLRPSFFHGTNNGASWNYYNHHHHHHPHHYDIGSHQQPQTIRCAENGKSYFELGSSNYCGPNRICGNNGIGMMKNCCEGRNNLWCTAKQCYKEKRLKMMNLSMFKLARFRQASDQSLYRSVLICNTLKSLEKEIELENQTYHQRMQQQHRQALQQQSNMEFLQSFSSRQQQQQQQPNASESNKQQQQNSGSNNESSMINCNGNNNNNNSNLSTCNNTSFSQPYTNNCIINRIPSFNDPMPIYEHHPLKDPSSGRATPFPSSPGISQLASSNSSNNSDADSAFGDIDDVDSNSTRSIDWGSVLINSQSALDPLSTNDIFTSSTTTSLTQTSSTITNLHVTISNGSNINSTNSSSSNTSSTSTVSSYTTPSSSSTPISSIITTLTTVSSCSLESLTASSISVCQNVSNSNWDFPYIDTESSNNSDYYELNCYKLSSALNQMDDFVKSDQLMTTSVGSVSPSTNELEQLGTHIMVGS
ncbi:hypothetical protein PVAND_002627 [Polypedilum vanderplanki]|uniref:SERTA domain-containing protein n=1 Tax=Polypedilum vanderplanki TaxID=319348 RepID=A0A9J6BRR3_POLVA|nr:hypothetical protein PVAND_002627 [Polypedilum vanderplanki]